MADTDDDTRHRTADVYTSAWHTDRRIYAVEGLRLPVALTYTQLAAAAAVVAVEVVVYGLVGLDGLGLSMTVFVWMAPALAAGLAADQPAPDGRSVHRHALARARWWLVAPRRLVGLRADQGPDQTEAAAVAYLHDPPAGRKARDRRRCGCAGCSEGGPATLTPTETDRSS